MGKFPRPKTMDIKNRQIPPQYAGHIENPVHAALTRTRRISPRYAGHIEDLTACFRSKSGGCPFRMRFHLHPRPNS